MHYSLFKNIRVLSIIITGIGGIVYAGHYVPLTPVEPAALETAGIRHIQKTNPNLNGSGVVIAAICRSLTYFSGVPQNDYRFNMHHHSLRDADVLFEDHSDGRHGISPHATAIGGILIGLDPQASMDDGTVFDYRGIVPYATVDVYEFWRFAALWLFARKPIPADIITLSLGNFYEDWWTRGIEQLAAEKGTVVVAAIGNGQAARDSTLYPAAGANAIGVGVIDSVLNDDDNPSLSNFASPTALHSSQGPTNDLRSKPDLVAPGTAIIPDAYTENGYATWANASSLAAPMVAGTAALLLQKVAQDETLQAAIMEAPVNCIIKAVLMNSARKLPYWHKGSPTEDDDLFMPLDRLQGAGALDATSAMTQLTAGQQDPGDVPPLGWDSRSITLQDTFFYVFEAIDSNATLTATLTWNRYYENHYPFQPMPEQSNLRLELWGIDPMRPAGMVMIDVSDSHNDTVEHLWTLLPENYSHYVLAVRYSPEAILPTPASERFALAWSVGPDNSLGHPLWEDLNGDGKADTLDMLIKTLLLEDNRSLELFGPDVQTQIFNLTPNRTELLATLWHRWKPYLIATSHSKIE